MSYKRPTFTRSPKFEARRARVQNASWRKRQSTVMIMPKRFDGVTLFEKNSNIERKNSDTPIVDLALPLTDAFTVGQVLNNIGQGVTNSSRIGRRALFKSIQYRFHLGLATPPAPTVTSQIQPVRILIVYDRQPNGALALATDVLNQATFQGHLNLNNSDRFLVLSDVVHGLDGISTQPPAGKVYKKISLDTMYSGTGATIADISSGAILAFISTPGYQAGLFINVTFRVRYQDL